MTTMDELLKFMAYCEQTGKTAICSVPSNDTATYCTGQLVEFTTKDNSKFKPITDETEDRIMEGSPDRPVFGAILGYLGIESTIKPFVKYDATIHSTVEITLMKRKENEDIAIMEKELELFLEERGETNE